MNGPVFDFIIVNNYRNKIRILLLLSIAFVAPFTPSVSFAETTKQPLNLSTPQQIESKFLKGLQLLEAGQPREAVFLFRQILAHDPNLPRVRLELARAYFVMRSWREARAEFVSVLSGGIPPEVRQTVLRFINTIDARRGFDWNAAFGFSLSPESGRRYKTDTVILDFFGIELPFEVDRPESDVFGVNFNGSAELRQKLFDLGGSTAVVGFITGSADVFEAEGSASDDYIFGASAGSRFIWPQTTAVVATHASLRHQYGEIYGDRMGINGAIQFRSETGFSPLASASYTNVNIRDSDARDGVSYSFRTGFSKSVLGSANIGAFVTFERFAAQEDYESYDAVDLSLFGRADIGAGFGVTVSPTIKYIRYNAKTPFFINVRKEKQFGIDIDIVKNDLFLFDWFSPFIKTGYTYNDSSIDIYTYKEYRFMIGIKNAF